MKTCWLLMFPLLTPAFMAAETETLSLQLTRRFDQLWDNGDEVGMYEFLDPDCVYKTPFRTELSRDEVRAHVFKNMHGKFRNSVSTETYSKIEGDMCYGVGVATFDEFDANGAFKAKWSSRYLNIYTRKPGGDWKLRFHVAHEDDPKKH
ncbi:MAG TPA: nuclear transport factor 2 family protein [Lacunisphaera sp.]|nr:nuclear transport factor 2 family protein [Lacunisphaera sp.]